jgi:hypothetical protein
MVVATNGAMAVMHTMHPLDFVKIKRGLANYPTRDPLKRTKDLLQADLVEELVHSHMPQYLRAEAAMEDPDEPTITPPIG